MAYPTRSQLFSRLTIEQQILLAVCSAGGSTQRTEAKGLLHKPFCWETLVSLSDRHRMLPLFYNNFKNDFGDTEIPPFLREKFLAQTHQTLKMAAETVRISSLLTHNNIANIVIKGPFLGQQLYGDLALRPSRDIDILISDNDIGAFHALFVSEGYMLVNADFELSPKQRAYYYKHKNQVAYTHSKTGIMVELHWRLFSQESLFPVSLNQVFSDKQEVAVGGKSISLLSPEHNFEFLCLHGAIHQWFRLRWLYDISQLVNSDSFNLDQVMHRAKENGNERVVTQALILSNIFFGSRDFSFTTDKSVSWLVNQAINAAIHEEAYTSSRRVTRLRIPIYKMKLKRGFRHKVESWKIMNPNYSDWRMVSLPDSLFFLYFILRPFFWFYEVYIIRHNQKHK
ncbi:nucleotidyltransferase domain-containing protein [Williamwhitmania taraxaci]|uniref:Uncharacterized nucleotidyltransferase n=1 Tax=Williamwhitmania taraxaci TaxID=1640674 RepID=A0A1G6PRG4_9BACT|nr:nucleotidyltransferase family protein [Williamwhitmania taraxaci]SDC82254.1 Uncharacterised nucleotidyltransferase [Williamwhitmania taraxaci]